ncbi:MAG: hypothetical protein EXS05_13990 [Planctomycetaceae bacterium]|nr:hypothetical protein [Planctomycetaceae bacterium]
MTIRPRLSRREMLALTALPAAAVCGWGFRQFAGSWSEATINDSRFDAPAQPLPDTPEINRLRWFAEAIEPLYSKMPSPEPDDWLANHVEFGQSFAQFMGGTREKLCHRYSKICLVPIGDLSDTQQQLFADTAEYLQQFFGYSVEILEPAALDNLPEPAQRVRASGTKQVLTDQLLNEILLPRRGDEMVAVVGFTASDLWSGDFGFLFGQASMSQRVCVCSVARFGDVDAGEIDYATCLRRTVGVVAHETGHTFGLPHCTAYLCRMTGSNHLAESDRRPLEFCPECLPKIWWTCGVDPCERFVRLSEFAELHQLVADGKLWRAAAARLAAVETRDR